MTNEKKEQSTNDILNGYVEKINQTNSDSPEMLKLAKEVVRFVIDSIKSERARKLEIITQAAKRFQEASMPFNLALSTIKHTMKESQEEGDLAAVSDSEIEQVVREAYHFDSDLPF